MTHVRIRMAVSMVVIVLGCCLDMLVPHSVTAATYYVATNGGDNGRSCNTATNINTPKASIPSGMACLSGAGDTLFIRAGTYTDPILGGTYPSGSSWDNTAPGGSVVWVGAYNNGGTYEPVVIEGGRFDGMLVMSGANYVVWDHLHLRGTSMNINTVISAGNATQRFQNGEVEQQNLGSCPGGGIDPTGSGGRAGGILIIVDDRDGTPGPGAQFVNNDLHHAVCAYAFYFQKRTLGALIEGNRIHDHNWFGLQLYTDPCDYDTPCFKHVIIRNNLFYNNGHGISPQTGGGANGCAMTLSQCDQCQVYNNVIYDNFCGMDITRHSANSLIANNTFSHNPADGVYADIQVGSDTSGIVIQNNLSYQSGPAMIGLAGGGPAPTGHFTESTNLFGVNPQFVNTGNSDFHLSFGSNAIQAGTNLSSLFSIDKDGNGRPSSGNWDGGAYQFGGTPASFMLVFTVQPINTQVNQSLGFITVEVRDTNNTLLTAESGRNITLSLGNNTTGAALGGTVTLADSGGRAVFGAVTVNLAGTYTLLATASGVSSATSHTFTISGNALPRAPQNLRITTVP